MQLTFDQQQVHQRAEIIDHDVAHHRGDAGLRIDLDFGDVAAIRVGGRRLLEDVVDVERLRNVGRQVEPRGKPAGEVHDTDAAIRAGHGEAAIREFDVECRGLQQVAGDLPTLLDHQVARLQDRGAARHDRFRAAAAAAGDQAVAVALDQADTVERDAQLECSTWAKADQWPWQ